LHPTAHCRVISSRLYNQPVDPSTGKGKYYSSWLDAFRKTAKAEGLAGFYKVGNVGWQGCAARFEYRV
jgi:hypothetical protein